MTTTDITSPGLVHDDQLEDLSLTPAPPALQTPRVTAVLVIHDGAAFLPRTLDAIEAQTRPPDVLIGVDAGSRDDGLHLLRRATPHILELGRDTSFGDAVQAALTTLEGHSLAHRPEPGDTGSPQGQPSPGPVDEPVEWLWLLHDDSAPAPDTLELLLDAVDQGPSIGIAGCKQVSWDDARRLLDVGFTTSPLGARVTGVDAGDTDQGQLDHRSDVLAVATSGMLVRRDVWERLGGPDPALSHARADLDLCRRAHLSGQRVVVVPGAVMAHAAATSTGRRTGDDGLDWAVRDRRAALHLRLVDAPWFAVPFLLIWLAGAALVRAAGRVALKQPERAGGELLAYALALSSPLAWWRARRRARAGRVIRRRDFRRLHAGPGAVFRQRRDALAAYLRTQEEAWAGASGATAATEPAAGPVTELPLRPGDLVAVRSETALRSGREVTWDGDRSRARDGRDDAVEPGPHPGSDDPLDPLDPMSLATRRGRRMLRRPEFSPDGQLRASSGRTRSVRLLAVIVLVSLAASVAGLRVLLTGTGQIIGPALLPMPASPGDLWQTALSGWRPVNLGLAAAGDPFGAVLALIAWPLGGSLGAATVLLLFGALPLSALAAWYAAGAITGSRALRAWAAVVWAANPALLLAVNAGRLGAIVAHIVIPLAGLALATTFAVTRSDSERGPLGRRARGGSIASSSAAGLLLTVLLAAAPALTLPVVVVLLAGLVVTRRSRRSVLWAASIPGVLLLPWWLAAGRQPGLLFAEPGGPSGTAAELTGASSWPLSTWPIDPATLGGPARDLAAALVRLLTPLGPAIDAGMLLRAFAVLVSLPLLLLALSAVALRPAPVRWARASAVRVLWLLALITGGLCLALPGIEAGVGAGSGVLIWPGALVSLVTVALLAAALCRLDGAAGRLRLRSAGWRHLGALGFGGLAVLMPLLVVAGWVADGWDATPGNGIHRGPADAVPEVAAAESEGAAATRTLVMQVGPAGVQWVVYRSGGPRTGDWSAAASLLSAQHPGRADQPMLPVLGTLLSGAGTDPRAALADSDIGSILLIDGSEPAAAQALDTAIGLVRVASTSQGLLWRVELGDAGAPTRPARARILDGGGQVLETLASQGDSVNERIDPGDRGRTLVLAERANPGWQAWLNGRRLAPQVHASWAQAFALPPSAGKLRVAYEPLGTSLVDGARLVVAGLALLGAVPLPIRRRRFLPPPAKVRAAAPPPATGPRSGRRALRAEAVASATAVATAAVTELRPVTPVQPDTVAPVEPDVVVPDAVAPVEPDTVGRVEPDTVGRVEPDAVVPDEPVAGTEPDALAEPDTTEPDATPDAAEPEATTDSAEPEATAEPGGITESDEVTPAPSADVAPESTAEAPEDADRDGTPEPETADPEPETADPEPKEAP